MFLLLIIEWSLLYLCLFECIAFNLMIIELNDLLCEISLLGKGISHVGLENTT